MLEVIQKQCCMMHAANSSMQSVQRSKGRAAPVSLAEYVAQLCNVFIAAHCHLQMLTCGKGTAQAVGQSG